MSSAGGYIPAGGAKMPAIGPVAGSAGGSVPLHRVVYPVTG